MVKRVVVKVSGKIVNPRNVDAVRRYAALFKSLYDQGYRLAVVVGGGPVAREYIEAARALSVSRSLQDMLGIEASRLNARLLAAALWPYARLEPPRSLRELVEVYDENRILIVGGFQPGQSTSAVAALVAEALSAELLVLATTVDGVYDKDPRRHPDAKMLKSVKYSELRRVLEQSVEPGRYELLDPLAILVLERSGIPSRVVDGRDPTNVERVLKGEDVGTLIIP